MSAKPAKKLQWSSTHSLFKVVLYPYPEFIEQFNIRAGFECITHYSFLHYDRQDQRKSFEALQNLAFSPHYKGKMKTIKFYHNHQKTTLATFIDGKRVFES
ncbi:MAG: hypothetical protein R3279_12565 [Putridiphycobacter sp.]|nr:hypothetical protein [Putridiphycobacter sp.]